MMIGGTRAMNKRKSNSNSQMAKTPEMIWLDSIILWPMLQLNSQPTSDTDSEVDLNL